MVDINKFKNLKYRYELALKVINNSECPYWGLGLHITSKEKKNCPYCRARMVWDDMIKTFGDFNENL